MASQKIDELPPTLCHIGCIDDDRVALPALLGQTQLTGLAPLKFFQCPTAALLNSLQPKFFRCVDKDHRITQSPPARFKQYGCVEEYGLLSCRFRLRDLSRDPPRDLRMNDLLQRVPRGAMRLAIAEDTSRERTAIHFARRVEDGFSELSPECALHIGVEQRFMPEPIGINDMHVRPRSHFPRDSTLPRTNAADNPDHGDASGSGINIGREIVHDVANSQTTEGRERLRYFNSQTFTLSNRTALPSGPPTRKTRPGFLAWKSGLVPFSGSLPAI